MHLDSTLASRVHGTHVERSVVLSTIPRRCVGSVLSLQDVSFYFLRLAVAEWAGRLAGKKMGAIAGGRRFCTST